VEVRISCGADISMHKMQRLLRIKSNPNPNQAEKLHNFPMHFTQWNLCTCAADPHLRIFGLEPIRVFDIRPTRVKRVTSR